MRNAIRPIDSAWMVHGHVPGPDVDEFSDAVRITDALRVHDGPTLLAVQHPHRTPTAIAAGGDITDALRASADTLDELLDAHYFAVSEVVFACRITGEDAEALGILCLADPAALDEDGRNWIRHSERVYEHVVAERAQVLASLGVATSAAMLVPAIEHDELSPVVQQVIAGLGEPDVLSTDSQGRRHELWSIGPGRSQRELLDAAGQHRLIVADGNHRVAAARVAGLGGLLALITAGPRLRIRAIHRVLTGRDLSLAQLRAAWREFPLTEVAPDTAAESGSVIVTTGHATLKVRLPGVAGDHHEVEELLLRECLGVDPQGPDLHAWPECTPPISDATVWFRLAPIRFDEVLRAHAQRRRMHRKSTFFTPKPRSGLVLASLRA